MLRRPSDTGHRPFPAVRRAALILVAGLAMGACQGTPSRPSLATGPTPEQVRVFCNGAKAPAPSTAEGFRLLLLDLHVASSQPIVPTPVQVRFSRASDAFRDAVQQELTYLQGRTSGRSKQVLDRALEEARRAMLGACRSLPATLLAGTPLPLPSPLASLDGYCAVADLPHDTPEQLAALSGAAQLTAPFRGTARNKVISQALMGVSAAAVYASAEANLSPELRRLRTSAPVSELPFADLTGALADLKRACR